MYHRIMPDHSLLKACDRALIPVFRGRYHNRAGRDFSQSGMVAMAAW